MSNDVGWGDTDRFLNTQMGVLQSRGLALRVAQKLKLQGNPAFYEAMEAEPPSPRMPVAAAREKTLGLLSSNLSVDLPPNSRIATIAFNSADPAMAAKIANAYGEEFIQSNLQRRYDSSAYARTFVEGQLAEAKTRLESSERELSAYARNAGLIRMREGAGGKEDAGAAAAAR